MSSKSSYCSGIPKNLDTMVCMESLEKLFTPLKRISLSKMVGAASAVAGLSAGADEALGVATGGGVGTGGGCCG